MILFSRYNNAGTQTNIKVAQHYLNAHLLQPVYRSPRFVYNSFRLPFYFLYCEFFVISPRPQKQIHFNVKKRNVKNNFLLLLFFRSKLLRQRIIANEISGMGGGGKAETKMLFNI